jgi:transposase-like protein
MGRRGYPPEFRRRALDLIDAGRKVRDVARDLGLSEQTIYVWRKQHWIGPPGSRRPACIRRGTDLERALGRS